VQPSEALLAHPDREAESTIPALTELCNTICRHIRAKLVNRSSYDIPVRTSLVEVTTLSSISDDPDFEHGAVFGMFRGPYGLPSVLSIQGTLLSRIIGVMLGERDMPETHQASTRAVTTVEFGVATRMANDLLEGLALHWPSDPRPRIELGNLSTTRQVLASMSPTMPIIRAVLDFGPPEDPYGLIVIALPAQATKALQMHTGRAATGTKRKEANYERVLDVTVDIVAEVARVQLALNQLLALQPGDIIHLGPDVKVDVWVDGQNVFTGEPGRSNGYHSVRISQRND
jgi:flagellar motor switch protein FliM